MKGGSRAGKEGGVARDGRAHMNSAGAFRNSVPAAGPLTRLLNVCSASVKGQASVLEGDLPEAPLYWEPGLSREQTGFEEADDAAKGAVEALHEPEGWLG
jgi:hypothetical protein